MGDFVVFLTAELPLHQKTLFRASAHQGNKMHVGTRNSGKEEQSYKVQSPYTGFNHRQLWAE